MVFTILCALDLGAKYNYEVVLPERPSIADLRKELEVQLGAEAAARRPGAPPFAIHRAQVFDERLEMWVDLVASSQLEDYGQIYIFQKETSWHQDTPGRIPPPVRPTAHLTRPRQEAQVGPQHVSPRGTTAASVASRSEACASPQHARPLPSGSPDRPYARAVPPPAALPISSAPRSSHLPSVVQPWPTSPPRPSTQPYSALAAPASAGRPQQPPMPGYACHTDKVRIVFDFLLNSRGQAGQDKYEVEPEDWRQAFVVLRLCAPEGEDGAEDRCFTTATVDDLFRSRADLNRDGLLSLSEMQRFAEVYPKLLDSMYFRIQQHRGDAARREQLEREHEVEEGLLRSLDDAVNARLAHEQRAAAAVQAVSDAEAAVEAARDREQEVMRVRQEAQQYAEEGKHRLQEARGAVSALREQNRAREQQQKSAQRAVSAAERKVQEQREERGRAEAELQRLLQAVEDQRREVERQDVLIGEACRGVDAAAAALAALEDPEADRQRERAHEALEGAEAEVRELAEAEQRFAKEHREAQRDTQRAAAAKSHADREAAKAKAEEERLRRDEEEADRRHEEQRAAAEQLQRQELEYEESRREEEQKENDLLRLEVRLREQRDAVERQEEHLLSAHRNFVHETGRARPL